MREILFRGKRVDNGERVEGYFGVKGVKYCIMQSTLSADCYSVYFTDYEVVPETVRQYIGLKDKNGKKVFEGDILKSRWDEGNPEDFCYEVVLWYENGWCIKQGTAAPDRLDGVFRDDCLWCSEVVGNVYDNPELLEVEDGAGNGAVL